MWSEKQIDLVENIYIGLWNSSVGGPKLKVFIDAVSRFTPEVVIESLEWIAKTQDKDLRPSLKTITQVCIEKMPKGARQMQPPPCDDGDEEKTMSFREYFKANKTVEVPPFMQKFLDDDDPRKKVKKQNGRTNKAEEMGLPTNPFSEQQDDQNALGAAQEGRANLADGG